MSRANEPAYPCALDEFNKGLSGLTIREHFAAMAMQGEMARPSGCEVPRNIAEFSVRCADALIAELDNTRADRLQTLSLAVQALLPHVDSEIDQRKTGGNEEDYIELQRLVDNVREALP